MTRLSQAFAVMLLTMTLVAGAQARMPVPIVDHEKVVWTRSDGKALGLDEIRARIIKAGEGKKWILAGGPSENTLIGTLVVRNKHTIKVTITYSASAFSVKYLDSINMKYGIEEPGLQPSPTNYGKEPGKPYPVIHPFYNDWVKELVDSIRTQLQN